MSGTSKFLLLILLVFSLFSCKKKTQLPVNKFDYTDSSSIEMIRLNKLLAEVEQEEIKAFLDTCSEKYTFVEPGIWISKTNIGKGEQIKHKDQVLIQYQIETLQGKICYTYTKESKQQLVVGKVEKQRGFNEALMALNEGDQASIIVPSNMAYGALGDTKNIPPRSTLIYRVYTINKIVK